MSIGSILSYSDISKLCVNGLDSGVSLPLQLRDFADVVHKLFHRGKLYNYTDIFVPISDTEINLVDDILNELRDEGIVISYDFIMNSGSHAEVSNIRGCYILHSKLVSGSMDVVRYRQLCDDIVIRLVSTGLFVGGWYHYKPLFDGVNPLRSCLIRKVNI